MANIEGAVVIGTTIYTVSSSGRPLAPANTRYRVIESYDTRTDSWAIVDSFPTNIHDVGVATANGNIYIIGGWNFSCACAVDSVFEYAPLTNTWSVLAPMPTKRSQLSTAVIANKIYAVGGWPGSKKELEVYDPSTNRWSSLTPVPLGREQMNSAVTIDGKIHFIGGNQSGSSTVWYSRHDVYDPVTDLWDTLAPMPSGRFQGNAVVVNDRIQYLGGAQTTPWVPSPVMFNNNYVYDSPTNSWLFCTPLPLNTSFNGAGVVNDVIYVASDSFTYELPAQTCSSTLTTNNVLPNAKIGSISIFPNPSTTSLTITSSDKITTIAITSLVGKTIFSKNYHDEQVQANVADLPAGMYLVRINGSEVRKFVKQ